MTKTRTDKLIERQKRLDRFVEALAEFLAGNQAAKSIDLEIESNPKLLRTAARPKWATEWAQLRATIPINGYPTVEEVKRCLAEFLK